MLGSRERGRVEAKVAVGSVEPVKRADAVGQVGSEPVKKAGQVRPSETGRCRAVAKEAGRWFAGEPTMAIRSGENVKRGAGWGGRGLAVPKEPEGSCEI